MQTGNADNNSSSTVKNGLVVNNDLIFNGFITGSAFTAGRSSNSEISSHLASVASAPEPTLVQAQTPYSGLVQMSKGKFRTITVAANGMTAARVPGDITNHGCVDNNDYNQLSQWYQQRCAG